VACGRLRRSGVARSLISVGGDGSLSYGRPLWMFHSQPAVIPLGCPDLLLSRFRRRLVLVRDLALEMRVRTPRPG